MCIDLLDTLEHVGVQDLVPVGSVELFDVGVLIRFPGVDVVELEVFGCRPVDEVVARHLGSVVHMRMLFGAMYQSIKRFKVRINLADGIKTRPPIAWLTASVLFCD